MIPPSYSIVIPVYNSEKSLPELFEQIKQTFAKLSLSFEVIFVNDFSQDLSWEVILSLKQQFPGLITAVSLSGNYGQHNATLCGMTFANGDFVITLDDDLQTPPKEIEKLIQKQRQTGYELIYGVFPKKNHSLLRNVGSKSLKISAKKLHNAKGEGSSFRLISRGLVAKIIRHQQNFIFLDEILLWYTHETGFTEVEHLPRKYDQSGYSIGKLFRLFANLVLYYTMIPLKVLVYGGLAISFITFFYGLFFIFKKLVFDVPLGYTSLIVTILFSTSIILFSIGVLGEYLSRIYQIQNGKPPWSVKKVVEIEKGGDPGAQNNEPSDLTR